MVPSQFPYFCRHIVDLFSSCCVDFGHLAKVVSYFYNGTYKFCNYKNILWGVCL